MSAPAIWSGIDWKLHCLARPVHSGVLAPAERPSDVEVEIGGQRQAVAKTGGPRSGDLRSGGLRSRG